VVIDAPLAIGDKLTAAIRSVTYKPVTHFIYTHAHADHVGATTQFGDVTRIAHNECARILAVHNDPARPGRAARRHKKDPCGARGHITAAPNRPASRNGGAVNRASSPRSVRYMSATTATRRPETAHHATRRDNEQNGPPAAVTAGQGPFSLVVAGARFELA
jgi:hypothetical protein